MLNEQGSTTLHIDFEIPTEEFFNRIGRKRPLIHLILRTMPSCARDDITGLLNFLFHYQVHSRQHIIR